MLVVWNHNKIRKFSLYLQKISENGGKIRDSEENNCLILPEGIVSGN